MKRSEAERDEPDARFLFLSISCNVAYGQKFGFEQGERETFVRVLSRPLVLDEKAMQHRLLFDRYSGPVRVLIENPLVFEPSWRALREHDARGSWEQRFKASQCAAVRSVMCQDVIGVLSVVFGRQYVPRNQLVHDGATWHGKVNRCQVKDGASMLGELAPMMPS